MYCVRLGSGKPVVWLHGWGCDGSVFLPIAKRLPFMSNFLVDLNGFGQSEPPPAEGWSAEDYAKELHAFLLQNGLTSVTLVGHSFGCRVALALAANYPEDVSRMLFVAPAGLRPFSIKRWWRVRVHKLKKRFGTADSRYASADWAACPEQMRTTFVKVVNDDLSRFAVKVRCPVLIVNGSRDEATPLRQAKRLNRLIKGSQLVEIEGGHFAFFAMPRAFADAVKNFVE